MFNYNSIASKLLFTSFDNSLKIIFGGETLNCSQSFTTISLLNSNVYQTILNWATSVINLAASAKGSTLSRFVMLDIQLLESFFGFKTDGDLTVALFDLTQKNSTSFKK